MELLQLRYFREVAERENFTKAAEKLCISQSSLSQTIGHLEKELGYQLFDRKGRSVCLNESGKVFYQGVVELQNRMDATLLHINEINGIQKKEISIYVACASMCIPGILRKLQKECPDVTFRILQMNHARVQPETDLVITAERYLEESVNSLLLLEEDIELAFPLTHKLAQKPVLTWQELTEDKFIALNSGWSLENLLKVKYEEVGFQPNVTIRLDNPSIMRKLLHEEVGIAFIPRITWNVESTKEELALRQVSNLPMKRFVYLKWKADTYQTKTMKTCMRIIQEYFNGIAFTKANLWRE